MLNNKPYVKAIVFLLMTIILLVPYSIGAELLDSGYDTEKSLDSSATSDSYLTIGRDTITTSYLFIDSEIESTVLDYSVTGYSYESLVSIDNNCDYNYYGRYVISGWNGANLVSGGYIQPDGDDITATYEGDDEVEVTAMTGSGGDKLILDYYDIPARSSVTAHVYMGNPDISRDQWWIADASDSNYITDNGNIDLTTNFTISTNIHLPFDPDSEQTILSKEDAYELLIDSTPQLIFRVYDSVSGTSTEVSRTVVAGIDIAVTCIYDGANLSIHTSGTSSQAYTGTVASNASNLHIAEFDGLIDETLIYKGATNVLNLQYEPEDCTDTTIEDLTSYGNDVIYSLAANPSCSTVEAGNINFTGETGALSSSDYPSDRVNRVDPLYTVEPDKPENNPDNAFQSIVNAFSDTSATMGEENRIAESIIAMVIYLGVLITVWIKMSKYVRDRLILGIVTLAVTAAATVLSGGLIPWGILILHGIVVLWMVVSERSQSI